MSFEKMRVPELLGVAEEFGVELNPGATKPVIIAALVEEGVTWDMAKTFDKNAAAIDEEEAAVERAGVITSDALKEPATKVSVDPVVDVAPVTAGVVNSDDYILVPRGQDGYIKGDVFYPGALPVAARPEVVLIKMERENPSYEVRGYRFTKANPFVLVKDRDVDFVLRHEFGFKVASPREAQEFYK